MDTSPTDTVYSFSFRNYVPSTKVTTLLFRLAFLLLFLANITSSSRELLQPSSSYIPDNHDDSFYYTPTPPLDSISQHVNFHQNVEEQEATTAKIDNFYADDIASENLFSPIFDFQSVAENYRLSPSRLERRELSTPTVSLDTNDMWINSVAGVESGSGELWDDHNENFVGDDSTTSASIMPTSVLTTANNNYDNVESTPTVDDPTYNRAPILNRRLPKLTLVSGQIWKYQIPADTFIDEDGDLRALHSSVFIKTGVDSLLVQLGITEENDKSSSLSLDRYFSWIQYNESSRLLYALPTENNAGKHELVLVVSDKWSATGRENLELHVKQHLSVRAFTHLVSVNRVEWDRQKYPSILDVLIRFIERLKERIFLSSTTEDFIVKTYTINDFSIQPTNNQESSTNSGSSAEQQNQSTTSFALSWSNSSLPVHPCDLNLIEGYMRPMVDTPISLGLPNHPTTNLDPSPALVKAMYPDFRLSNLSINLRASCDDITGLSKLNDNYKSSSNFSNTSLRVRMRIGMLTWKLGEPIEYQIPSDTFELEGLSETKGIQMSIYTIDGLLLSKDPKYRFLEFDEETATLFGMPYNLKQHSGQRELLLNAVHPASGSRTREVFMLNIEPQDLTMINNRAFKMSMYFGARVGEFGPKQRILMSHKIVQALRVNGWLEYQSDPPQFTITDIQKFYVPDYSGSGSLYDSPQSQLNKVVKVVDEENSIEDSNSLQQHRRYFYKFSWTNSSIGIRGDCPVEVINENILFALEQSMLDLETSDETPEESAKNDSTRFYDRLRLYFDPEFDLIHLRFEPLGACQNAIGIYEAGNSEIADSVDKLMAQDSVAYELLQHQQESNNPNLQLRSPKVVVEPDSDEYWSIIVLIVLVMVLIFVIVMFFLGIHTYKINQDKKFELQVRLAQARQNSMYLSSMILANQDTAGDIFLADSIGSKEQVKNAKSMYVIHDEDKKQRKQSVILEGELGIQQPLHMQQSMVGLVSEKQPNGQLTNETIIQHPFHIMKPSATLTQMHPNGWQIQQNPQPGYMLDDKRLSMTLNRRFSNSKQKLPGPTIGTSTINHSQSILTVASIGGSIPVVSNVPVVYAAPVGYPTLIGSQPIAYMNHHQRPPELMQPRADQTINMYAQNGNKTPLAESVGRSPSYSSSASGTTKSVIMNPYYNGTNR